jgi:two-component system, cell cycle response regulator
MTDIDYSKELILIVASDPKLRESLRKSLGDLKFFSADSTPDGNNALKMLGEKEYTILLCNITAPNNKGVDFIKKVVDRFNVDIIVMTDFSVEYNYVEFISAGASDFIKKPFGIGELEAKIRRIITERNMKNELNRLSITDSLTELYNQRHFYARLNEEVVRAERQRHPLSLILLDLDDFKKYNDTNGHLAGDEVLRHAGEIIGNCIREGVDSGYRYGGDEFAIIVIDAKIEIAKDIGRRLKKAFSNNGKISVSIGYSKFKDGMSVKDLVSEADRDLYKSKTEKNSQ